MFAKSLQVAACLILWVASAQAQTTLGALLDKGGKKMVKNDYLALTPFRVKYEWPIGGGEGDLVFSPNGTLIGTEYHWNSRSESPATGSWTVDDNGKWCIKKDMAAWNSKTDQCWFAFKLGDEYFWGRSDMDRDAAVGKVQSFAKIP